MKLSKEAEYLKSKDKILEKIILEDLEVFKSRGSVYESLLSSIISQQISTSAANSIRERFLKIFRDKFPTTKQLLSFEEEKLRSAGLSKQKVSYMKSVAKHWIDEKLDEKKFTNMSDEEIINDLVKIKGVGEWTAEMILMFSLLRPDIYSYKDLALTNTVIELYKIKKDNFTPKKLKEKVLKITKEWSPQRSLASRYLWHYRGLQKKKK